MRNLLITAALLTWAAAATAEPTREPHWVHKPDFHDENAVWPASAPKTERGEVNLACHIDRTGALQNCRVVGEDPPGLGFGDAVLKLVPKFKAPPGAETDVQFSWTLAFSDYDTAPNWIKRPTDEDLHAVWPTRALHQGIGGHVVLRCRVNVSGQLENCVVASETPPGMDFGAAALALSASFVMKPATKGGRPVPAPVGIPITWADPGGRMSAIDAPEPVRVLNNGPWLVAPTFSQMAGLYPKQAAALDAGHAVLRCGVDKDGGLRGCEVMQATPPGKGFDLAAKRAATLFRARVGGLSEGLRLSLRITVPIEFDNPARPAPSPRFLNSVNWVQLPDAARMSALFPRDAFKAGVRTGRGVAECVVAPSGALRDCVLHSEDPAGLGFGAAAVLVASDMALSPWTNDGRPVDGAHIRTPIRFNLSDNEPPPAAAPPPAPH